MVTITNRINKINKLKEFYEVSVKNDEHLVKLAGVIQRIIAKSSGGEDESLLLTESEKEDLQESVKNQEALNSAVTITLAGTGVDDFIAAVNGAGLTNVSASKTTAGAITMTHKNVK